MKLILLAVALSAVAFAAPRTNDDAFVEETLLVQSKAYEVQYNSVKKQFSELQVQLKGKSYAQVTPGVKKTIDQMKDLIENEIEVAINDAHHADQELLNTEMGKIQTYTATVKTQRTILYATAKRIRGMITEHNNLVNEWRDLAVARQKAATDWTNTHNKAKTTCCAKDNAGVVDVAYLAPYHQCDFKTKKDPKTGPDGCTDRALANAKSYVDDYFKEGFDRYNTLVKDCNDLNDETVRRHNAYTQADLSCDNKEQATRAKADEIATETDAFEKSWKSTRNGYRTQIAIKETEYNNKEADVKRDTKDRKAEWESSQIIKCMLINYQEGGGFDDAALSKCKAKAPNTKHLNIVYPPMVKRLTWELEEFEKPSEYDHASTCHAPVVQAEPVCQVVAQKPIPECTNHMA